MAKWLEDFDCWIPQRKDLPEEEEELFGWVGYGNKRIPNYIFAYLLRLPPVQFKTILGLQLFDMNDPKGLWLCHPSNDQMVKMWNTPLSTVERWLTQTCDRVGKDGEVVEGLVIRRSPLPEERRQMRKGTQRGRKIFEFTRIGKRAFEEILGRNYDTFARECEEKKADRDYEKAKEKRLREEARGEGIDDLKFKKAMEEGKLVEARVELPSPEEIAQREKNLAFMDKQREEDKSKRVEEALEELKGEEVGETPTVEEIEGKLEGLKGEV